MDMTDEIRKKAREALAKKGWSQQDLAEKAGVRQATVSRFLAGERGKAGATVAILEALGLELTVKQKKSKRLAEKGR